MSEKKMPRYPVYVPSKGRADRCSTAKFLVRDGVPFRLVVEEQEAEDYAKNFGEERLLILPFRDRGSVIPARNWIKEHATEEGHERHWQLDDNCMNFRRWYRGDRVPMRAGVALACGEDFTDRYENIAVSGMNYTMFAVSTAPPFYLNVHVYSCSLILNSLPYEWRGEYNEDTDYCLQALADGWCTVLFNAFLIEKIATMVCRGGNTDELYRFNDGRLKMARSLERQWPGVVETKRRFKRPQHVVKSSWRKFDTPLRRKPDVEIKEGVDEYGMKLKVAEEKGEVKSGYLKKVLEEHEEKGG